MQVLEGGDGDEQESDVKLLVARKLIAELEVSLEFFKAEAERLRDEKGNVSSTCIKVLKSLRM